MKKNVPLLILIAITALISCTKTDGWILTEPFEVLEDEPTTKIATFGPQTGHPFSIDHVLKVYNSMDTKGLYSETEDVIQPTHLYLRFMPATLDEIDLIKKRHDLVVYQYPLDCEITEGFIDATNPYLNNGYPQYWCVVPVGYSIDNIGCQYEVESLLWFPSFLNEPSTKSESSEFEYNLYLNVCKEQGLEPELPIETKSTKYYPSGYVKYADSDLGVIGIEGMEVDAYNFWHNYDAYSSNTGYLNYNGHYFTSSYRYRIKFERDHFAVKLDSTHYDLEYVTSSTTSSLNKTFNEEYAKYSVIFQAAYRYYYQDIDIPRPPYNGIWDAILRICVYPDDMDDLGRAGLFTLDHRGLLADRPIVKIWCWYLLGEFSSKEIYGNTIHELTHAMHWNLDKDLYYDIENRVLESVAVSIQDYLTKQRYPLYEITSPIIYDRYTYIMRDLVDGIKTVECEYYMDNGVITEYNPHIDYYDNISFAYTYGELIEAVKTCTTPNEWRTRVWTLYPNRTSWSRLSTAFNFWFEL